MQKGKGIPYGVKVGYIDMNSLWVQFWLQKPNNFMTKVLTNFSMVPATQRMSVKIEVENQVALVLMAMESVAHVNFLFFSLFFHYCNLILHWFFIN
jgi:hypothetical protein